MDLAGLKAACSAKPKACNWTGGQTELNLAISGLFPGTSYLLSNCRFQGGGPRPQPVLEKKRYWRRSRSQNQKGVTFSDQGEGQTWLFLTVLSLY